MEKQKQVYRYYRYEGKKLLAKREIPFSIQLSSRLILDELCYNFNKASIEAAINKAIDKGDKKKFIKLSKKYKHYTFE